jgi:leucine dehydrogenase
VTSIGYKYKYLIRAIFFFQFYILKILFLWNISSIKKMEDKFIKTSSLESSSSIDFFGMNHEKILFCQDKKTGLKAIIAVHNTVCGPALGGTRMWNYVNDQAALTDVMRLSRGMTYKNSISGLNLGGGKAVIIGDSKTQKSPDLFKKFGEFVDLLAGSYITAEDVGISPQDMLYVYEKTNHVTGLPGKKGDPSPITAYGVYMGMKAALKFQTGSDNLNGKKIVVQGIGHVGLYLLDYLHKEGAEITVCDINAESVQKTVAKYGCNYIDPDKVYQVDMDIYSPCALGATINDSTIDQLKCSVIAGAANNQLMNEKTHGEILFKKGIVYAPDYLINAGGVMNCYAEIHDISDSKVMEMAGNIYQTTTDILKSSRDEKIPTSLAANKIAEKRISDESKMIK